MRSAECGIESEPLTPRRGLEETLALTPALSPRRGGSTHSSRNFHALWCGIASWGLTSAATRFRGRRPPPPGARIAHTGLANCAASMARRRRRIVPIPRGEGQGEGLAFTFQQALRVSDGPPLAAKFPSALRGADV